MKPFIRNYLSFVFFFYCLCSLNVVVANSASSPQCGIDQAGNSISVWQGINTAGSSYIQAASHPVSGAWSAPVTISALDHHATNPVLDVNYAGDAVAIWSEVDKTSGNSILWGAMYRASKGTWSAAVAISSSTTDILNDYSVKINVGSNKIVVANWSAYDSTGSQRHIYASTATIGGSWKTPAIISDP